MTESKNYPKILRSKKENMIFFPGDITEVQKENMEGKLEIFYQYDLIKIPDKNQQIKDYDLFKKQNYAELRKQNYRSWQEQFEIMQEQGFVGWLNYCKQIKIKYPKEK